jgi:DNA-binding response OmpR family regulator
MFAFSGFEYSGIMFYVFILGLAWCLVLIGMAVYFFILHKKNTLLKIFNLRGNRRSVSSDSKMPERSRRFIESQEDDANRLGWSDADAAAASDAENQPTAEGANQSVGKGKTILIADDDPVIVYALSRRLQQLGFHVIRSPDAAHALMGAMKLGPDLVILDVNMPSGNGLAVCEMMASDPRYAGIPVVIHSVLGDEATKERCRKLGAWYVEKSPKSWTEIKSLVETLLGQGGGELGAADSTSESADTWAADSAGQSGENAVQTPDASAANETSDLHAAGKIEKDASKKLADSASHTIVPVCGHARVLCIDGPGGELEMVENRLAALGVEVTRMHDLEEGFWACFTEKPHAVIIEMAGENEKVIEILHRFTTHPLTKQFPVIFINHKNEIPEQELPNSPKFTVANTPVAWKDLMSELETIIPIAGRQDEDPLAKAASRGDEKAASEPVVQSIVSLNAPLRILCIDDDPMITKAIEVRMKPYGIEVKGAETGTAGYLQAVNDLPDVILLDLQMPNGDGHYVLAKLKEHHRTKDIPVIMLTAETHQGVRRQMLGLGAAGFLSKPVHWKELFEALGQHVPLPKKMIDDYKLHEDQIISV